jgi:hypothetical protein
MAKLTKTKPLPDGLRIRSREDWGHCTPIRALLESDCHGKCYICEDKPRETAKLTVDHVVSRNGNPSLEFEWDNLLLACQSCNSDAKGRDYDNIINPCETDPESVIGFGMSHDRRSAAISTDSRDEAVLETKQLLDKVYGDRILARKLAAELDMFCRYIPNALLGDDWAIEYISENLSRSAIFAAFKRKMVRDDQELCSRFSATLAC